MAKKQTRKFDNAGEVIQKTAWNAKKTRKWEMTYKLVEVKPGKKSKKKAEPKPEAVKKAKKIIAKSKKTTKKKSSARKKAD